MSRSDMPSVPRSDTPTRRDVLQRTGGALGALGAGGFAGATPEDAGALGGVTSGIEYNVGFSGGAGLGVVEDLAAAVVRRFDSLDVITVRATEDVARTLRQHPDVRYVEHNGEMRAFAQTVPWGVDRVDADVAHADGETASGAHVAVLDTGIDSDHPDLAANLGEGVAVIECGAGLTGLLGGGLLGGGLLGLGGDSGCRQSWDDDNDHGTHIAGTVGALDNDREVVGVAPRVTLHAVKVLDDQGSGSASDAARGLEIVADRGWDVANLSFGGNQSEAVKDAVEYAAGKGVTIVAAAGNAGSCTDCVGYPAAYEAVIAVSATDEEDDLAGFSSQGPEVDLAAPGTNITSTAPGGTTEFSGSSMAAPHVAGAAGHLAAEGATRGDIRSQLKATAEDVGLSGNEAGAGLLDLASALGLDSSDDTR